MIHLDLDRHQPAACIRLPSDGREPAEEGTRGRRVDLHADRQGSFASRGPEERLVEHIRHFDCPDRIDGPDPVGSPRISEPVEVDAVRGPPVVDVLTRIQGRARLGPLSGKDSQAGRIRDVPDRGPEYGRVCTTRGVHRQGEHECRIVRVLGQNHGIRTESSGKGGPEPLVRIHARGRRRSRRRQANESGRVHARGPELVHRHLVIHAVRQDPMGGPGRVVRPPVV